MAHSCVVLQLWMCPVLTRGMLQVQRELLGLCCEFDQDEVVPYLRTLNVAASSWALQVTQQHASLDGQAYLHHSAGDLAAAARCAMQHLATALRSFRAWVSGDALPEVMALCSGRPGVGAAAWHDLITTVIPAPSQLPTAAARGDDHRARQPPRSAAMGVGRTGAMQALRSTGQGRVARIRAALAAAQRFTAAAPVAPSTPPSTSADAQPPPALPPLGNWETLLLLLLAELATAQQQSSRQPGPQPPSGMPAGAPQLPEPANLRLFLKLWAAYIVPLLDSVIKACIENGQYPCLAKTLNALGHIDEAVPDQRCTEGGGLDTGGGWEHLGALVSASDACVHEVATAFGKLCLSAHRTALHLKNSQMQVMASDVVQLQGECLKQVHCPSLTPIE